MLPTPLPSRSSIESTVLLPHAALDRSVSAVSSLLQQSPSTLLQQSPSHMDAGSASSSNNPLHHVDAGFNPQPACQPDTGDSPAASWAAAAGQLPATSLPPASLPPGPAPAMYTQSNLFQPFVVYDGDLQPAEAAAMPHGQHMGMVASVGSFLVPMPCDASTASVTSSGSFSAHFSASTAGNSGSHQRRGITAASLQQQAFAPIGANDNSGSLFAPASSFSPVVSGNGNMLHALVHDADISSHNAAALHLSAMQAEAKAAHATQRLEAYAHHMGFAMQPGSMQQRRMQQDHMGFAMQQGQMQQDHTGFAMQQGPMQQQEHMGFAMQQGPMHQQAVPMVQYGLPLVHHSAPAAMQRAPAAQQVVLSSSAPMPVVMMPGSGPLVQAGSGPLNFEMVPAIATYTVTTQPGDGMP